jgi:hypothetical protein
MRGMRRVCGKVKVGGCWLLDDDSSLAAEAPAGCCETRVRALRLWKGVQSYITACATSSRLHYHL